MRRRLSGSGRVAVLGVGVVVPVRWRVRIVRHGGVRVAEIVVEDANLWVSRELCLELFEHRRHGLEDKDRALVLFVERLDKVPRAAADHKNNRVLVQCFVFKEKRCTVDVKVANIGEELLLEALRERHRLCIHRLLL
eukprot:Amastigsp_a841017_609.p4 type:complete len:137 gc:universal Amastigsp_a841017_609:588-178(-)